MIVSIEELRELLEEKLKESARYTMEHGSETDTWVRIEKVGTATVDLVYIDEFPGTTLFSEDTSVYFAVIDHADSIWELDGNLDDKAWVSEELDELFYENWTNGGEDDFNRDIIRPLDEWLEGTAND